MMSNLVDRAAQVAWFSISALAVSLTGCEDFTKPAAVRGPAVSPIYTNFDPEVEFRRLGFQVAPAVFGGQICPQEKHGWRPRQGCVELPPGSDGCECVAAVVQDALNRTLGKTCRTDPNFERQRERGRPFYGVLRYVHLGMRGHVHIWLFPDAAERKICYAILLREERLSPSAL